MLHPQPQRDAVIDTLHNKLLTFTKSQNSHNVTMFSTQSTHPCTSSFWCCLHSHKVTMLLPQTQRDAVIDTLHNKLLTFTKSQSSQNVTPLSTQCTPTCTTSFWCSQSSHNVMMLSTQYTHPCTTSLWCCLHKAATKTDDVIDTVCTPLHNKLLMLFTQSSHNVTMYTPVHNKLLVFTK